MCIDYYKLYILHNTNFSLYWWKLEAVSSLEIVEPTVISDWSSVTGL
jgi:hypothetical protein